MFSLVIDQYVFLLNFHIMDKKHLGSLKVRYLAWLVWLSGLSASLRTKGSLVRFPVRAHAWVVGQVPSEGCM